MSKVLQSRHRSPVTNMDMASSSSLTSSSSLWKQPITWLSAMWFGLCASLVHKYNDLIGIFISFLASFVLAWGYQQIIRKPVETIQSTASSIQSSQASAIKSRKSSNNRTTTNVSKSSITSFPNSEWKNYHGNIQDMVGLTTCLVSLLLLQSQQQEIPFSEFHALTICTGYLAFALWYSALFCRPIPPPILSILEDCITLTVMLIYLTRYQSSLSNFYSWIQFWILYKTLAFVLSMTTRHFMSTIQSSSSSSPKSTTIWTIHGVDYDLTGFVHPGGSEALELGRGRDCSALFESYHPFTEKHWHVLKKYQMDSKQKPDPRTSQDPFYKCLKERVAKTLREKGIPPETHRTAPPLRVAYYFVVFLGLTISAYYHAKASLVGSFLFGIFGWLIGALGHDAGHFAVSRISVINDWAVWGMSLLCNPIMWQHQHTFAHHSHTNEFDHDPDLHHFHLFLRVHRKVRQQSYYQNQRTWPYVMVAYMFVVFGTCVWIPLDVIKTGFLYGIVECTDRHRPWRALAMIVHFMAYIGFVIILPLMTASSISWGILCIVIHMATSGWLFGIFSQINHISGECLDADAITRQQRRQHDTTDDTAQQAIETIRMNSWAAAQVETSNNFAPQSWLWHILSNGLNLQIEHHLFPSVNHSHLHIIAPVVEQTCREFGVQYKCFRSWSDVMRSTLTWLDQLAVDTHLEKK